MYTFYIWLAIQVLKKVLPVLKKKALETPNQLDDSTIAIVELAIELYETGKLTPGSIVSTKSRMDI